MFKDFMVEVFSPYFTRIEARFIAIEKRLDAIEIRLDKIEDRLDKMEYKLDDLADSTAQNFQDLSSFIDRKLSQREFV